MRGRRLPRNGGALSLTTLGTALPSEAGLTWSSETSSSRPFHRPSWLFPPLPLRCVDSAKTFAPFCTCEQTMRGFGAPPESCRGCVPFDAHCRDPPCCGWPGRRSWCGPPHAVRQCCTAPAGCQEQPQGRSLQKSNQDDRQERAQLRAAHLVCSSALGACEPQSQQCGRQMSGAAVGAEQCSHAPQGPRTWVFIISLPAIAAPVTIPCTRFL